MMKLYLRTLSGAFVLALCAIITNGATAADHLEAPALSKGMAAAAHDRSPTRPGGMRYDCTYGEGKVDKCNCNSVVDCINLSKANHCKGKIKDLGGGKGECTAKSSAQPAAPQDEAQPQPKSESPKIKRMIVNQRLDLNNGATDSGTANEECEKPAATASNPKDQRDKCFTSHIAPATPDKELMGHEATHTVQQKSGRD